MRIIKCDRCGEIFDMPKVGELVGFQWVSIGGMGRAFDLCPACMDRLSDFLEMVEELPEEPEETPEEELEEPEETPEEKPPEAENVPDTPRKRGKRKPPEFYVRERLSGKSPRQIADENGVKANSVSRRIAKFKEDQPERYAELVAEHGVKPEPKPEAANPT